MQSTACGDTHIIDVLIHCSSIPDTDSAYNVKFEHHCILIDEVNGEIVATIHQHTL